MLIDLDVAPSPARPRPRPDLGRLAKQAFLVLVALLLGGATTPAAPAAMVKVADTGGGPVSAHVLTTTALYTVSETEVRAIPLAAGGPSWRAVAPSPESTLAVTGGGSTIAVLPAEEGRATFLDSRTGKVRWRAPNYATIRLLNNRVAMWIWLDGKDTGRLWVADTATGRTRWARASGVMSLGGDERRVVTIDEYGRGTVLSAADGTVLAARRNAGLADDGDGFAGGAVIGNALYWWTTETVRAYRLPDLAPMWEVPARETRAVAACGALICLTGRSGTTVVEPSGGNVRWVNDWWRVITGDVAVSVDGRAVRVDLATGRVVDQLGRGGPVGELLLRFDGERDWATGLADGRMLGALPPVIPESCSNAGPYLACPTNDRALTVWKAAA